MKFIVDWYYSSSDLVTVEIKTVTTDCGQLEFSIPEWRAFKKLIDRGVEYTEDSGMINWG